MARWSPGPVVKRSSTEAGAGHQEVSEELLVEVFLEKKSVSSEALIKYTLAVRTTNSLKCEKDELLLKTIECRTN